MRDRLAAVLVAVLVLASSVPIGVGATNTTATAECETVVTHDAFRFDQGLINATANGSGTSTTFNTHVRVEQATGFVRVHGENPNGYCVRFIVGLPSEIVAPAALGEIEATDSTHTATWRAVRDFNRSVTYTRVAFTLPAGTNATFAPSDARVAALRWTGTATSAGSGLLGNVSLPFTDDTDDLTQRKYTLSPEGNSTIITVPLQNRAGNRTIDDYRARYKTPNSGWRPVGTDATAPVFKREIDGGAAVQFQFNNPDARVKFVANPTRVEEIKHGWISYMAGWDILDSLFGGSESSTSSGSQSKPTDDGWLAIGWGAPAPQPRW